MATHNQETAPIPPVSVADLAGKNLDPGSKALLEGEADYIRAWREKARPESERNCDDAGTPRDLTGIALSGGGIRSATFALGILQALAGKGLLSRFDYLSTVSGGGYIGSSLSWLLSDKANQDRSSTNPDHVPFGTEQETFPFGSDDPRLMEERKDNDEQRNMGKYLRQHGNYLSPGKGISMLSLIGITVRGTVLNLLVWMPLLIVLFIAGFILSSGITCGWKLPETLLVKLGLSLDLFSVAKKTVPRLLGYELLLWGGLAMIAFSLLITIIYSVATYFRRGKTVKGKEWWYKQRRRVEKHTSWYFPLAGIFLVVGSLPLVASFLVGQFAAIGSLAMIGGFTTVLKSFLKSVSSEQDTPLGLVVPLAAVLFLYGVVVVCFQLAVLFISIPTVYLVPIIGSCLVFSLGTGWFVNTNYISPHRFYRDRLMETFMPDISNALKNKTGSARGADSARMQDISSPDTINSPYHIVNTNVVLVNSRAKNVNYKIRGGDNFILSPLYCGGNATGWCPTGEFMGGKMTLATAVAISGAAANPNAGVGGAGLTRNKFLSLVMSFLNLRLGYWAHNPARMPKFINLARFRPGGKKLPKQCTLKLPNHFWPGGYSFLNLIGRYGFSEERTFVQLSDGGHFENTAIYELIRRRSRLILASDGGADPKFSFSDLQTLNQRMKDDFDAELKFIPGYTPDEIMPKDLDGYPSELPRAKRGYMLAVIRYADESMGLLIYLKTTLLDEVTFKVKGYAAQHHDFPDQSTGDQFFDELQVEAYRELGFQTARQMVKEVDIEAFLGSGSKEQKEAMEKLLNNSF